MHLQCKTPILDTAEITVHSQVELWVVIFHCRNKLLNGNLRFQLLPNLALQCLFGSLARLNLSTGEFPEVFEIAISSLSGKYSPLIVVYDCCNYLDLFQHISFCVMDYTSSIPKLLR